MTKYRGTGVDSNQMNAVVITRPGAPEVLQLQKRAAPSTQGK